MRIGIFGGTFDPPHIGHLILAAECLDQLKLDRLLWVLTSDPPHKQGQPISPLGLRLEMVRAAIHDNPAFEMSTVDIDRPGPHFAVDTVRLLTGQFPGADMIYLMGGDSLHNLPDWHTPQDFVEVCTEIGVMRRPGAEIDLQFLDNQLPGLANKVRFIEASLMEIAATEIRQRVARGRPFRYYLPTRVYEVVERYGLYRDQD